jgi:predicted DNA-binding protein (MmcQ/YjbR family)
MDTETLQAICAKFPGVTEDIKWENHLCFCVAEKMFLVLGLDTTPTTASFKVSDDEFDELSARKGFKPAPYMARNKWVFVDDISRMGKERMAATGKYCVRAHKKQTAEEDTGCTEIKDPA